MDALGFILRKSILSRVMYVCARDLKIGMNYIYVTLITSLFIRTKTSIQVHKTLGIALNSIGYW
jgi:hypothetical protein